MIDHNDNHSVDPEEPEMTDEEADRILNEFVRDKTLERRRREQDEQ
ncbi:MAG: hypothetical protein WDZ51_16400 [Pirellulaceae bacterium]